MGDLLAMYEALLSVYGPQGWWPLLGYEGSNPTKTGRLTGYHVGLYDFPRTPRERVEICVGAILTQNTAWANVEKALVGLEAAGLLLPESILEAGDTEISEAIRPSGYFNVKARKLRELALFLVAKGERTPTRSELLSLWGIGPETADSILLYAY